MSSQAAEKVQIRCLQMIYHVNTKSPFQPLYLPNVCEAHSRNIYIPATV